MLGLGIHGQSLFVDHPSDTVIAVMSTWSTPTDPDRRRRAMQTFRETAKALSVSER